MDENIILSTKGLDLWYGTTQALKDVSMDIPEKQVTALIGPSGCGKSTFLKTLDRMNDLVPGIKITGSIQYRGIEIYDPSVDVTWLRKQIGMVFQKPNPFPMSIYDNVAYGPRTHGIKSKSKLDDIVEKSLQGAAIWDEVKDRLKKSALGLSGGQQQRLCIARALAVKPEVLLMDRLVKSITSCLSFSTIRRLWLNDFSVISLRGSRSSCSRIACMTGSTMLSDAVTSMAWLSTPCSAWERKSAAIKAGLADSSAITSTSEGPAGMSMATSRRLTNCLAAVTY